MKTSSFFMAAIMAVIISACDGHRQITTIGIPATPTAAPALTETGGNVTISVTPITNADTYRYYRGETTIARTENLSVTDSGRTPGVRVCYRYSAVNAAGESERSPEACITPNTPAPVPGAPAAPTIVSLTQVGSSIVVMISDLSNNETGFRFYLDGAATWAGSIIANVTTITLTGVSVGAHTVAVTAWNTDGESPRSTAVNITMIAAPAAPTGFSGTAAGNCITFSWTDNASTETGFLIQEGVTVIETLAPNTTGHTECSIVDGTHTYTIVAENAAGNSSPSTVIVTVGTPPATAPAAPTNLALSVSGTTITATWTDNASTETGFRCRLDGAVIVTVSANVTTCDFTGLTPGATYGVTIGAFNGAGETASASQSIMVPIGAPAQPTNLLAVQLSPTSAQLTWTDNATNETSQEVRRGSPTIATATTITTLGSNVVSFTNAGLTTGTTYCYEVRAVNGSGNATSNSSCVTLTAAPTPLAPNAPMFPSLSQTGSTVVACWIDASDNEDGFRVNRSGTTIDLAANQQCYTDTGLTMGQTYQYTVSAFNGGGENSAVTLPITLAPPPTNDVSTAWMAGWTGQKSGGGTTISTVTDADRGQVLRIAENGGAATTEPWQFQLYRTMSVTAGQVRTFRGWVKINSAAEINLEVGQVNSPFSNLGLYRITSVPADAWTYLNFVYVITQTEPNAKAMFHLGNTTGTPPVVLVDDASEQ